MGENHCHPNLRFVHDEEGAKALGVDRTQQVEEANAVVGEILKVLRNHLERARKERLENLGHVGGDAGAAFRIENRESSIRIKMSSLTGSLVSIDRFT
jgi:hypothetical protein